MDPFRDSHHDLTSNRGQNYSNDDDGKWSYFREESLLHVWHALLHKLFSAVNQSPDRGSLEGRSYELFFYAHKQFLNRFVIGFNDHILCQM